MNRLLYIFTVLLHLCILCRSQTINYHCDFDTNLVGDCKFTSTTSGPAVSADSGPYIAAANTRQPSSDVKAILSTTQPDNQPCQIPYKLSNADMYFCRRYNNNTHTCQTESGSGRCNAGKFGQIRPPTSGKIDHSYSATVTTSSNTVQCLDFYYFITDALENAKIEVSWETNDALDEIVVVQANPSQNAWQHSRTTFNLPPSTSSYQLVLRIMRNTGILNFFFAFDEIKIYDGACDSIVITTTSTASTTTTTTSTVTTTTPDPTTSTPVVPDTTTTITPTPEPTTSTPVVLDTTTTTTATPEPTTATPVIADTTTTTTVTPEPTTVTPIVPDTTTTTTATPEPTTATPVIADTTTTTTATPEPTTVTPIVPDSTTTTTATSEPTTATPIAPDTTKVTTTTQPTVTTTTTSTTTATSEISKTTTTTKPAATSPILPDSTTSTNEPDTTTPVIPDTTTITTPEPSTTTTIIITTTTIEPLRQLLVCDFMDNTCFDDTSIIVTNGTEVPLLDLSQPPRAPLSDATSVNKPTLNTHKCNLPYQLFVENSTNTTDWDMWFCYNNQCPTQHDELSECVSGNYGLVFLDPSDANKTISTSISQTSMMRSVSKEHCVRFNYYFTVYDGMDWGQQISIWIKSDSEDSNAVEIDRIRVDEMKENRWYERNKTFTAPSINYTLIYSFEVRNDSDNAQSIASKTIYFALDNIELYNRNCDDALGPHTITTTYTTITSTIGGTDPPPKSDNLGLILGLSFGLGIPALLILVIGAYCYLKRGKHSRYYLHDDDEKSSIPLRVQSTKGKSDNLSRYIY